MSTLKLSRRVKSQRPLAAVGVAALGDFERADTNQVIRSTKAYLPSKCSITIWSRSW